MKIGDADGMRSRGGYFRRGWTASGERSFDFAEPHPG